MIGADEQTDRKAGHSFGDYAAVSFVTAPVALAFTMVLRFYVRSHLGMAGGDPFPLDVIVVLVLAVPVIVALAFGVAMKQHLRTVVFVASCNVFVGLTTLGVFIAWLASTGVWNS